MGPGPYPGMVIIHHAPGWDEWYRECARKFAHHGYATISPNLYFRDGHGTAEDVGAKVRYRIGLACFCTPARALRGTRLMQRGIRALPLM